MSKGVASVRDTSSAATHAAQEKHAFKSETAVATGFCYGTPQSMSLVAAVGGGHFT